MADVNCVTLTGRLTRDGELRYSQNGSVIVRFSIAVGSRKRNADGTWGDEASFFDCVYFGKAAEATSAYLTKGKFVGVVGELRQNKWEGNDGQTRYRVEIYVNQLTLLSTQSRGEGQMGGDALNARRNPSGGYQAQGAQYAPQPQSGNNYTNNSDNSYSRMQAQERPVLSNGPEDFQDDDIPF